MNKLINGFPLLVLVVLGVLGINQVKGTGNRDTGTGKGNTGTLTRDTGTGKGNTGTLTKIPDSKLCEIVPGSIYDGDTLRVSCNGAIAKVRLACIDAPEAKQQGGIESRDFVRNLIKTNGSEVAMIPLEQDRYGRTVAELILSPDSVPEVSVQEELLKSGNARIYEQYSNCPNISAFRLAQDVGKSKKVGIWSYNSIPPWDWRKQNK
jgi:endonuclease YncB( thermonuclease family)